MKRIQRLAAIILAAGAVSFAAPMTFADDMPSHGTEKHEKHLKDKSEKAANEADRAYDSAESAADRAVNDAERAERNVDRAAEDADRAADRADDADIAAADDRNRNDASAEAAPDAEAIRDVLAQVTQASLTVDGFDDLVERLVDADRNRIGEYIDANSEGFASLNGQVERIRAAWEEKYGSDFKRFDEEVVFDNSFAAITQSEQGAVTAGSRDGTPGTVDNIDAPRSPEADANRNDPGRNTGAVAISPTDGSAPLHLELIHEFPMSWRIDVPDSVDGKALHDNLLAALTEVADMKDQWPSDETEAYRIVSQRILSALVDDSAQEGTSANMN